MLFIPCLSKFCEILTVILGVFLMKRDFSKNLETEDKSSLVTVNHITVLKNLPLNYEQYLPLNYPTATRPPFDLSLGTRRCMEQ